MNIIQKISLGLSGAVAFGMISLSAAEPQFLFEKSSGKLVALNCFTDSRFGVPLTLQHYSQKWQGAKSFVFDGTEMEGRLVTADGNRVAVHYQMETTPSKVKGVIRCSAEEPFGTGRLMYAMMLKLIPGEIPKIKINGNPTGFAETYDPAKPYSIRYPRPADQENVIEIAFPRATLKITGKFDVMLQEMRKWNSPSWDLRLLFTPESGMLTQSELSFQLELTPVH